MLKNNPNITSIRNKDFITSLKRTSFIQMIDNSGHLVIDYNPEKFPFSSSMMDLLIERKFLKKPVSLDQLHNYLPFEDMQVDKNQINNVIKSLYDTNQTITNLYQKFMSEIIANHIGENAYIQKTPTNRFSFPFSKGMSYRDYHIDIMLGHPPEEINVWVPFTNSSLAKSFKILPLEYSLELLNKYNYDMQAIHFEIWNNNKLFDSLEKNSIFVDLRPGQALLFDSRCFHASVLNESNYTRVSMDVRIIPANAYDNLPFTYVGTGRRKSEFIVGDYYSKTEVEL